MLILTQNIKKNSLENVVCIFSPDKSRATLFVIANIRDRAVVAHARSMSKVRIQGQRC